ncbi:hypothetical protein [Deinococcus altitudinis]|uniref:hypothetical protein n=1 Tax=Deinococcus altitudinis TaxID=468914 RepID=UPI00389293F8
MIGTLLLLILPTTVMILLWLRQKNLLEGNSRLIVISVLLSYLLVPFLLFLYLSVVAYSFKGDVFENVMLGLAVLLGAAALVYGSVLKDRKVIPFLVAGLTELVPLLVVWAHPIS